MTDRGVVEPETMSFSLRCVCGETVQGTGKKRGTEADARVRCAECDRNYVVTITHLAGSVEVSRTDA